MTEDGTERSRSPQGHLGYLFRLAYQGFHGALNEALERHELTAGQYAALSAFDAVPELSSAELARRLDVTAQTMNTTVRQLLDRRLLRRRERPTTGRALLLTLSESGRRRLDAATVDVRRVEAASVAELDAAEQRVVRGWLSGLALAGRR